MAAISDDLLPFNSVCAACCSRDGTFRFCMQPCKSNEEGGFEMAVRIGDPPATPHLHRVCQTCGYEWLERTLGLTEPAPNA